MSSTLAGAPKAPKGYRSFQQFTPDQMKLFKQSFGDVGPDSYLSRLAGGDQAMFDEIENPALKQFSGIQGQMASRFSGMGLGGRKSSGFQNTINQASMDFAGQLQSQRQNLQQQAIKDLMGLRGQLLGQQPYGLVQKQQSPSSSGWGSLIGAGVGGLGGFFAGGPAGAMSGAQLGYGIGSNF